MAEPKLISADSHVNEPGDLWVERIDKQFRERAPRAMSARPFSAMKCSARWSC